MSDSNRTPPWARGFFDILSIVLGNKIDTPLRLPSCLDELVDWSEEGRLSLGCLSENGLSVTPYKLDGQADLQFFPMILKTKLREGSFGVKEKEPDTEIAANQRIVAGFPHSGGPDLAGFYDENVLVLIKGEPGDKDLLCISVMHFGEFIFLLRRLMELVQLDDAQRGTTTEGTSCLISPEPSSTPHPQECAICRGEVTETVLPCMHAMCEACEKRWLDTHQNCPFCRTRYSNKPRRKREQWQLERWSTNSFDVRQDIASLAQKLRKLWSKNSFSIATDEIESCYVPLKRSILECLVDDDFVLLM